VKGTVIELVLILQKGQCRGEKFPTGGQLFCYLIVLYIRSYVFNTAIFALLFCITIPKSKKQVHKDVIDIVDLYILTTICIVQFLTYTKCLYQYILSNNNVPIILFNKCLFRMNNSTTNIICIIISIPFESADVSSY
jgi:hypothetical protein